MSDHIDEMAEQERRRTEQLEESLQEELEGMSYPVESSEVSAAYADGRIDIPNETEALGVAFDRLTDTTYETEQEAREAVMSEITGQADEEQGGMTEYNQERNLEEIDRQDGTEMDEPE